MPIKTKPTTQPESNFYSGTPWTSYQDWESSQPPATATEEERAEKIASITQIPSTSGYTPPTQITTTPDYTSQTEIAQEQIQQQEQAIQEAQESKVTFKQQAAITMQRYDKSISSIKESSQYDYKGKTYTGTELKHILEQEKTRVKKQLRKGMKEYSEYEQSAATTLEILRGSEQAAAEYYSLGQTGFTGMMISKLSKGVERKQAMTDYPLAVEQIYDCPGDKDYSVGSYLMSEKGKEIAKSMFYSKKWETGKKEYTGYFDPTFEYTYGIGQGTMGLEVKGPKDPIGINGMSVGSATVLYMAEKEAHEQEMKRVASIVAITLLSAPIVIAGVGIVASQLPGKVVSIGGKVLTGLYGVSKAVEVKDVIEGKLSPISFAITTGAEILSFAIGSKFYKAGWEYGTAKWTKTTPLDYEAFIVSGEEHGEIKVKEYVKEETTGMFFTETQERLVSTTFNIPEGVENLGVYTEGKILTIDKGFKWTGERHTYTPSGRTSEFVTEFITSKDLGKQDIFLSWADEYSFKVGKREVSQVAGFSIEPTESEFAFEVIKLDLLSTPKVDSYLTYGVSKTGTQTSEFQGKVISFLGEAGEPSVLQFIPGSTTYQAVNIFAPGTTRAISRVMKPFSVLPITKTAELFKPSKYLVQPSGTKLLGITAKDLAMGILPGTEITTKTAEAKPIIDYDFRLYDAYGETDTAVFGFKPPTTITELGPVQEFKPDIVSEFKPVQEIKSTTISEVKPTTIQIEITGLDQEFQPSTKQQFKSMQEFKLLQEFKLEIKPRQQFKTALSFQLAQEFDFLQGPKIPDITSPRPPTTPLPKIRLPTRKRKKGFELGYKARKRKKKPKDFLALPDPISALFEQLRTRKPAGYLKGPKYKKIYRKRLRIMGAGFTFPTALQFKKKKGVKI